MNDQWNEDFFKIIDIEREKKKKLRYFDSYEKFSHLKKITEKMEIHIGKIANKFYTNEDFNFYSNAYLSENLIVFAASINKLKENNQSIIKYLEIGVNKGISSLAIQLLCNEMDIDCEIIGIDPYFEDGYIEGVSRNINKTTKNQTLDFLKQNSVNFKLIEKTSNNAFLDLIHLHEKYNMIYIDGRHEMLFPLVDIGSYINLLSKNGFILIDDYYWRDVFQIKNLFDLYAKKLCESWKIASYQVHSKNSIF